MAGACCSLRCFCRRAFELGRRARDRRRLDPAGRSAERPLPGRRCCAPGRSHRRGRASVTSEPLSFFGGFSLTFRHLSRPRVTVQLPRRRSGPSSRASTGATCSTATRTAWRSASAASCARGCARPNCIYVRGLDNPPDHPVSARASATATSTRSTTCAASTATSASRPARPRRSPSRSCSSSPSPTAPTPSTPRPSCSSTTRAIPKHLPWEDWRAGEAEMTGGWMRATSPVG